MKKKSKQIRRERLELLPSKPDDPQPIHDLPKLPGLQQLRVLNLLYSEGPLSVRQLLHSKKLKIQDRRYSTILSLLRRMHEASWLPSEEDEDACEV